MERKLLDMMNQLFISEYNPRMEYCDKFKFVTKVFAMKGIKIELLGIAIIPLGIAVTTNNFWGYVLGVLGFGVAVVDCFLKDNH